MLNSTIFSAVINICVLAYLIYCLVSSRILLCRIVAALIACNALFGLLLMAGLQFGFLHTIFSEAFYFHPLAMGLFASQLFMTASKIKGAALGWEKYYYVFAGCLLFMALFFVPVLGDFLERGWFRSLYMQRWPELVFVITFVVMRVKRITINADENKLLWFFSVAAFLSALLFFCHALL